MEELGIKFSTEQLFEKLTDSCNPKNFTGDSYDEERLELANGLYQQILMNADDIFALEEIEGKAGDLIKEYKRETQTQPMDDSNEEWLLFIWVSIISFLFIILLWFFSTRT